MSDYDEAGRAAYREGVREALDSLRLDCNAPALRAADEWALTLVDWTEGERPLPPQLWPEPSIDDGGTVH